MHATSSSIRAMDLRRQDFIAQAIHEQQINDALADMNAAHRQALPPTAAIALPLTLLLHAAHLRLIGLATAVFALRTP